MGIVPYGESSLPPAVARSEMGALIIGGTII